MTPQIELRNILYECKLRRVQKGILLLGQALSWDRPALGTCPLLRQALSWDKPAFGTSHILGQTRPWDMPALGKFNHNPVWGSCYDERETIKLPMQQYTQLPTQLEMIGKEAKGCGRTSWSEEYCGRHVSAPDVFRTIQTFSGSRI